MKGTDERITAVATVGESHITHTLHPEGIPKREVDALAALYRRAIECYEEAKAAEGSGGEDAKEGSRNDHRATESISP